jgi:hypothetical protein
MASVDSETDQTKLSGYKRWFCFISPFSTHCDFTQKKEEPSDLILKYVTPQYNVCFLHTILTDVLACVYSAIYNIPSVQLLQVQY